MMFVVVAVCASASWAKNDLTNTLIQKTDLANLYKKAQVTLTITSQQEEDYVHANTRGPVRQGMMQTKTTCSAVLLNAQGAMAVKKDCLRAINREGDINLFVDLKTLGVYKRVEETVSPDEIGAPLYYETDNASRTEFVAKKDYILFSLPIRSQAVRTALSRLFANGKQINHEQAVRLLNKMPAVKTVQALYM